MSTPYLTPDTLAGVPKVCARLRIPNEINFYGAVRTAILSLTHDYEWEKYGSLTPQEAAREALAMYNEFTHDTGWCMLGAVFPYVTVTPPDNTLPCDGSMHLRTDYPALYTALAPVFVTDADHFVTPDLRGKVGVGAGLAMPGYGTPDVGDTGGEYTHTLTAAELATHSHGVGPHSHTEITAVATAITIGAGVPAPSAIPGVGATGATGLTTDAVGSNDAHNNIQPFLALNYCIVAR